MTKSKYSPWMGIYMLPVRDGVYQRDYGPSGLFYCKFGRGHWYVGCSTPADAECEISSSSMKLPWRGLAADPEAMKEVGNGSC